MLHLEEQAGSFLGSRVKVSLVAVFSGLALATNYALVGIPNVKLMDALVFIAAFLFGLRVGAGVALTTWAVYGTVNPYGWGGFTLLIFLMVGECVYAVAGYLLKQVSIRGGPTANEKTRIPFGHVIIFGMTGLLATFAYDVLTNFASYIFFLPPSQALIVGMASGLPFAIIHEVTNLIFFMTTVPTGIATAQRFMLTRISK